MRPPYISVIVCSLLFTLPQFALGAMPAPPEKAVAPQKPEAQKQETPKAIQVPSLEDALKDDYARYLAQGDRNPKWDDLVKSAFETFGEGNYATASIFLKKAVEEGCQDPLVLFRLGLYQETRGDFIGAANFLAAASQGLEKRYPVHPLIPLIPKHAGRALYKADQYDAALLHLKKALEQEPDDFMLLLMNGQIARMQKRSADARPLFERALKAPKPTGLTPDPTITVLGELIVLTYELKDFPASERYVDQVLALSPTDPVAIRYRQELVKRRMKQKETEILEKIVR